MSPPPGYATDHGKGDRRVGVETADCEHELVMSAKDQALHVKMFLLFCNGILNAQEAVVDHGGNMNKSK